jgi:hypothetical protein
LFYFILLKNTKGDKNLKETRVNLIQKYTEEITFFKKEMEQEIQPFTIFLITVLLLTVFLFLIRCGGNKILFVPHLLCLERSE